MDLNHLADFLSMLEDDGELVRISQRVETELELAAIADRILKETPPPAGAPAILFDDVAGHTIPVVVNLLGSERRLCRALRIGSFQDGAERIAGLSAPDVPEGWFEAIQLVPRIAQLTKIPTIEVKTGLCQQVVKLGSDVDLFQLPIPRCWPEETGPTLTAAHLVTSHPVTGDRCVIPVTAEVQSSTTIVLHADSRSQLWPLVEAANEQQTVLSLALVLGGDPVLNFAVQAPLPRHVDPYVFAGFLRQDNLRLVRGRSVNVPLPATAEIVIEGHIDPTAEQSPGHVIASRSGFYAEPQTLPVMSVTAVTHRANPVFPQVIVSPPPMELDWLERANERIFLPLIRLFVPEVCDIHWPASGAFRNLLFVSIRKQYAGQARRVMHALWSLERIPAAKFLVVVDEDVNVRSESDVWFHATAHAQPGRDTTLHDGPVPFTDHSTPTAGLGRCVGIDGTRKSGEPGHPRIWPRQVVASAETAEAVAAHLETFRQTQSPATAAPPAASEAASSRDGVSSGDRKPHESPTAASPTMARPRQ